MLFGNLSLPLRESKSKVTTPVEVASVSDIGCGFDLSNAAGKAAHTAAVVNEVSSTHLSFSLGDSTASVLQVALEFYKRLRSHPINTQVSLGLCLTFILLNLKNSVSFRQRVSQELPPANMVLLRGPGERIEAGDRCAIFCYSQFFQKVSSFLEAHEMRAFMVAPTCIIAGLGMSLDMGKLRTPRMLQDMDFWS